MRDLHHPFIIVKYMSYWKLGGFSEGAILVKQRPATSSSMLLDASAGQDA
jgi:hypothetical protein